MILLEGSEHEIKACITPPPGSGRKKLNWHERSAVKRSAFGQSTAGNDVVATIVISLFFFGTSVRRSSGPRSGVAVRAVDCWQ